MKISIRNAELMKENHLHKASNAPNLTEHHRYYQKAQRLKRIIIEAKKAEIEVGDLWQL